MTAGTCGSLVLFLRLCQGTAQAPRCHLAARASLGMLQGQGTEGSVWAAGNPPEQTQGCPPHLSYRWEGFSLTGCQVAQPSPVSGEC